MDNSSSSPHSAQATDEAMVILKTENMFSGPCFGDCSPSNVSPTTTISVAPSPSTSLLLPPNISPNQSTTTNGISSDDTVTDQATMDSPNINPHQESWTMELLAKQERDNPGLESSPSVSLNRECHTENQPDPLNSEEVPSHMLMVEDNLLVSNHQGDSYLQDFTNAPASQPSQPSPSHQENSSLPNDSASSKSNVFVTILSSPEAPDPEFDELPYSKTMLKANSPCPNPTNFNASSSPPSSSPHLLFSSSPLASSQSSIQSDDVQPSTAILKHTEEYVASQDMDISAEIQHQFECTSSAFNTECGTSFQADDFLADIDDSHSPSVHLNDALTLTQEMDSDENFGIEPSSPAQYASSSAASFEPPGFTEEACFPEFSLVDSLRSVSSPLSCPTSSPLPPSSSPPEERSTSPVVSEGTTNVEDTDAYQANEATTVTLTPSMQDLPKSPVAGQLEYAANVEIQPSDVSQYYVPPNCNAAETEATPKPILLVSPSETVLGKRKADCDETNLDFLHLTQFKPGTPTTLDDVVFKTPVLPNPKRSTIAAQKMQYKKLSTPFRSPVLKRPKIEHAPSNIFSTRPINATPESENLTKETAARPAHQPASPTTDSKKKHRTPRASAQFKSPLSTDTASRVIPSVRMTPTIQALERKLQILKRAVKVKQDGDEETLEALVKKWTEAGREVAWEVWELVKDRASSDDQGWGQSKSRAGNAKEGFADSWGWKEKGDEKVRPCDNERNWGWDVVPRGTSDDAADDTMVVENLEDLEKKLYDDDEGDEERKQDTLGTMLMQLGIAPETLGWNEGEGTFQDD